MSASSRPAPGGVFDVHAHYLPPSLREEIDRAGGGYGIGIAAGGPQTAFQLGDRATRPTDTALWELERRLQRMDRAGVDVQVLSIWTELTGYHLGAAAGSWLARRYNDLLADDIATRPDRFLGLATLPMQDPEAAAAELRRCVDELGLVGAGLATALDGPDFSDPALDPVWEEAARTRAVVELHPIGTIEACGVDPAIATVVGRPAETSLVVARMIAAGVLDRFPELRLVIVHGGGFLPYQIGRLAKARRVGVTPGPDPVAAMRRMYYDSVLNSPVALRFLLDVVGAEHVLLGSDDPFPSGDTDPLATLAAVEGLDEEARRLIAGGSLERLLADLRAARASELDAAVAES